MADLGTTEYNVDMISRRLPDESPETIVAVMSEVLNIVCSQDSYQTEKIGSNGMPPYLVTTDGVYEYDCPSDCRRTVAVFSTDLPLSSNVRQPAGPSRNYYHKHKSYYKLPVSTRDKKPDGTLAKIYFRDNPGDSTTKYYHSYYTTTSDISDISIQLPLPINVHYILREAVVSLLTSDQYGKSGYDDAVFQKALKKIRAELNKGDGSSIGRTPVREVDQETYNDRGYYR